MWTSSSFSRSHCYFFRKPSTGVHLCLSAFFWSFCVLENFWKSLTNFHFTRLMCSLQKQETVQLFLPTMTQILLQNWCSITCITICLLGPSASFQIAEMQSLTQQRYALYILLIILRACALANLEFLCSPDVWAFSIFIRITTLYFCITGWSSNISDGNGIKWYSTVLLGNIQWGFDLFRWQLDIYSSRTSGTDKCDQRC